MVTIRTASIREIDKLPKTAYKVLVMRRFPFYIKNIKKKITEYLPVLSPNEQLLTEYLKELKRTKNPKLAWNLVQYETRFRMQMLRDSKAISELKRIRDIGKQLNGKRVVYLICHEHTDDYCHRRILQELMLNYEI